MEGQAPPRDFTPGFIVFGVIEFLIALLALGAVPLMFLGAAMGGGRVPGPPLGVMAMSAALYAGVGAFFGTVGVGSLLVRRWAWKLMLVASWTWLAVGALSMVSWLIMLPRLGDMMAAGGQKVPETAVVVMQVLVTAVMVVIYVLVPVVFILFYGSRAVRLTAEWKDPQPRWTDRVPGPVLAGALLLAAGAAFMPLTGIAGVLPVFGVTLTGAPAALVGLAVGAGLGWTAWGFCRLMPAAWWTALGLLLAAMVSSILTLPGLDMAEMYRKMGYSEELVEMMLKASPLTPMGLMIVTGCSMVAYLGFVLFLRRYFAGGVGETERPAQAGL